MSLAPFSRSARLCPVREKASSREGKEKLDSGCQGRFTQHHRDMPMGEWKQAANLGYLWGIFLVGSTPWWYPGDTPGSFLMSDP